MESIKKYYRGMRVSAGTRGEENKELSKWALPHVGADKSEAEQRVNACVSKGSKQTK